MEEPKEATLTLEELEKMREFFKGCNVLPDAPVERMVQRMSELREMGLEDIPTYKGISSPMRQYALASIGFEIAKENGQDTSEELIFATGDKKILANTDALEKRYGVKPIHAIDMLIKLAIEQGNTVAADNLRRMKEKLDG